MASKTVSAPAPRVGAVGTPSKPSTAVKALLRLLGKGWTVTGSVMPELHLRHDGRTVAYLVQREGEALLTVRYRQRGLNLKRQTVNAALAAAVKKHEAAYAKAQATAAARRNGGPAKKAATAVKRAARGK